MSYQLFVQIKDRWVSHHVFLGQNQLGFRHNMVSDILPAFMGQTAPFWTGSSTADDATLVIMGDYKFSKKRSDLLCANKVRSVFRGINHITGEPVVVKVYSKKNIMHFDKEGFTHEAKVMKSQATHPNIVPCLHAHESKSYYNFVFEYCNGGDLGSYLGRIGRLPEATIRSFIFHMRRAMQVLQDAELSHGWLQSSNIIMVCDAQNSRDITNADPHSISVRIQLPAIRRYMKFLYEKQGRNESPDLFSIGVILYECLMSVKPYTLGQLSIIESQVNIAFRSDTSKDFDDFIWNLLQRDDSKRMSFDQFMHHPGGSRESGGMRFANMDGFKILNAHLLGNEIILGKPEFCHISQYDVSFAHICEEEKRRFLFMNPYQKDMMFNIVNSEGTRLIPGHKYILNDECPKVDMTMDVNNVFTIEDYSVSSLITVLRFIYTKELVINLSEANVMYDVLRLAKRFSIESIRNRISICEDDLSLIQWQLLRYAYEFNDTPLKEKCLVKLDKKGSSLFESADFNSLAAEVLTDITGRSSFQSDEVIMFEACVTWAAAQTSNNDGHTRLLRKEMEPFIRNFRFPCMTKDQVREIEKFSILKDFELLDIYKSFLFPDHVSVFRSEPRTSKDEENDSEQQSSTLSYRNQSGVRYKEIKVDRL